MIHFLNGKFVPEDQLLISPRDMGYTRGYGVFDLMRTYGGRPFMLDAHIERLLSSAAAIGLPVPWDKAQIMAWVMDTLAQNDNSEKMVKVYLSGAPGGGMVPLKKDPTIIVMIEPEPGFPASLYEQGMGVMSVRHDRYLPGAKTNNYIEGVKRSQEAAAIGAAEPLYYGDVVYEGSNSNIFAVIDGALCTPATHILPGITRGVLLDILKLDIPVRVADFTLEQLRNAPEAFFSGSNKEVAPVTMLDGKPIGDGKPGPVTQEVMRQYTAHTLSGKW